MTKPMENIVKRHPHFLVGSRVHRQAGVQAYGLRIPIPLTPVMSLLLNRVFSPLIDAVSPGKSRVVIREHVNGYYDALDEMLTWNELAQDIFNHPYSFVKEHTLRQNT